jgi:hypothetical protein
MKRLGVLLDNFVSSDLAFTLINEGNQLDKEVDLFANHAGWVEFGSTNTVGVSSSHYRPLSSYFADFSHNKKNLTIARWPLQAG